MYTLFLKEFKTIWTLISDPSPNKVVSKVENVDPKMPKQAETKRGDVTNLQHYNFNQFYTDNFDSLKMLRIKRSRP